MIDPDPVKVVEQRVFVKGCARFLCARVCPQNIPPSSTNECCSSAAMAMGRAHPTLINQSLLRQQQQRAGLACIGATPNVHRTNKDITHTSATVCAQACAQTHIAHYRCTGGGNGGGSHSTSKLCGASCKYLLKFKISSCDHRVSCLCVRCAYRFGPCANLRTVVERV